MDLEKLFSILSRVLIVVVALFILTALAYKLSPYGITLFAPLLILGVVFYVLYSYRKETSFLKNLRPIPSIEGRGSILTLARMVERASKGYELSRKQVNLLISSLKGEDITIEGEGDDYLMNLEMVMT